MKKLFLLLIFLFSFLIFPKITQAADTTFTCSETTCSPNNAPNFLSNEKWYPGKSEIKTVSLTNTASFPQTITLHTPNASTTNQLDTVINLTIKDVSSTNIIFSNTLSNLFNTQPVIFPAIEKQETILYTFTFSMKPEAGNTYQNGSANLDLFFTLTEKLSPTPTPTPTPTPPSTSNPSNPTTSGDDTNNNDGNANNANSSGNGNSQTPTPGVLSAISSLVKAVINGSIFSQVPEEVLGASESAETKNETNVTQKITEFNKPTITQSEHCTTNTYWPLLLLLEIILIILIRKIQTKIKILVALIIVLLIALAIFLLACAYPFAFLALLPLLLLLKIKPKQ